MYKQYFGFSVQPFAIAPNSRFLFQSQRHKEAVLHLMSGLGDGNGLAMLTGEVGTGKTTLIQFVISELDDRTSVGIILNPTFSNIELLEAICDEFAIDYPDNATLKQLSQAIQQFLKRTHNENKQALLVIDEAQHLSAEVLEQLRLITNLEADSQKLLKVLLIGQPELQQNLQTPNMRQVAQRITGRYHLLPLSDVEVGQYIQYRLKQAGGDEALFDKRSIKLIAQQTQKIPRLINLVCDSALKMTYQVGAKRPSFSIVEKACDEVMSFQTQFRVRSSMTHQSYRNNLFGMTVGVLLSLGAYFYTPSVLQRFFDDYLQQNYPTPPAVISEVETFSSELISTLQAMPDFEQGMEELYKVWGYQASIMEVICSNQAQARFYCHQQMGGSLQEVAQQNMPVLLHLNIQGQSSYAVLYELDANRAELLMDGKRIAFEPKWLDSIWQGEFTTIWQRFWPGTFSEGMRGESVYQFDHALSILLNEPTEGKDIFDQDMMRKVATFQRRHGLMVDGIAGPNTLQLIEKLSQPNAPKLMTLGGDEGAL